MTDLVLETLRCYNCGRDFDRVRVRGQKPLKCPRCRTVKPAPKRPGPAPKEDPGYQLARNVTKYRLAIEIAIPAIKIGRYQDALDALEAARR